VEVQWQTNRFDRGICTYKAKKTDQQTSLDELECAEGCQEESRENALIVGRKRWPDTAKRQEK
jgi:hypothetical protein